MTRCSLTARRCASSRRASSPCPSGASSLFDPSIHEQPLRHSGSLLRSSPDGVRSRWPTVRRPCSQRHTIRACVILSGDARSIATNGVDERTHRSPKPAGKEVSPGGRRSEPIVAPQCRSLPSAVSSTLIGASVGPSCAAVVGSPSSSSSRLGARRESSRWRKAVCPSGAWQRGVELGMPPLSCSKHLLLVLLLQFRHQQSLTARTVSSSWIRFRVSRATAFSCFWDSCAFRAMAVLKAVCWVVPNWSEVIPTRVTDLVTRVLDAAGGAGLGPLLEPLAGCTYPKGDSSGTFQGSE
jgi:hypothetical protein